MGIVVRDTISGEFSFLQKGADVVMVKIAQHNDWLKEETTNLLSEAMYEDFKCGTTLRACTSRTATRRWWLLSLRYLG
jgi:hypothetical protein